MKSCLSAASTLLAAICATLFACVTALILFAFIAERIWFSAGAYKQALIDQNAYARMPGLVAEQIIYQEQHATSGESLAYELKRLTRADWEIMLSDLLTQTELQTQAESVIDQFFTYLNSPSQPLELKISLAGFKLKLEGEAGYHATLNIITAQPVCTSTEWAQIITSVQSAQFEDIPLCRPTDEALAAAEPYIRAALPNLAAAIPNEIYLDSSLASAGSLDRLDGWRAQLQRLRGWIELSLCLPVTLLVLTTIFGVRSLAGGGVWLGFPLALAGLLTFLAAQLTRLLPGWLIAQKFPSGTVIIEGLAPGLTQILVDVSTAIVRSAASTLTLTGVVLVLLGAGLLAVGGLFGLGRRWN